MIDVKDWMSRMLEVVVPPAKSVKQAPRTRDTNELADAVESSPALER